jgi:FkbH-like protein
MQQTERHRVVSGRIEVIGSFNTVPLQPILAFWQREMWPEVDIGFAPYGQLLEPILGHGAVTLEEGVEKRAVVLLLLRPEDLLRSDGGLPRAEEARLWTAKAHLREIADAFARAGAGRSMLVVLPPASELVRGDSELTVFDDWARALIAGAADGAPAVHMALTDELESLYEIHAVHDPVRDELGHIPFTDEYLAALSTALMRSVRALWGPSRKVIALDCDNTLWGGACGEDGADALEVDGPYAELRRFMRGQAESGRLLCLVSRNREADVLDAFERRAKPLEPRHITAHRIRLQGSKAESLLSLAAELGLSPDSFIFVDDDPIECAEVRAALPAVAVTELPRDPAAIPGTLRHAWEFDVLAITDEDRRRAAAYATEARRRLERSAAPSVEEFVAGLEVRVEFQRLAEENVERAAQILARTNQFNLTGARWSEQELIAESRVPTSSVSVVRVRDRLGDYGLVGVLICRRHDPVLDVHVLALSCRVLNRGVEAEVLAEAGRCGRAAGCSELAIAFCDSGRNAPAAAMLARLLGAAGPPLERSPRLDLDALPARLSRLRPGWAEG